MGNGDRSETYALRTEKNFGIHNEEVGFGEFDIHEAYRRQKGHCKAEGTLPMDGVTRVSRFRKWQRLLRGSREKKWEDPRIIISLL